MNMADEPKYLRLKRLLAFSRKYKTQVSGHPALGESFNKLRNIRAGILRIERTLLKGTKPWTQAKANAGYTLADKACILTGALGSLGHDTGNDKLPNKWDISPSDLNHDVTQYQLISYAGEMLKTAETNITRLSDEWRMTSFEESKCRAVRD